MRCSVAAYQMRRPRAYAKLLRALLQCAGLPVDAPRLGGERYLDLMGRDKKVVAGSIRFVLLRGIGDAFVATDVQEGDLRKVLEQ